MEGVAGLGLQAKGQEVLLPVLAKWTRSPALVLLSFFGTGPHLAGLLGQGLANLLFDLGWVRRSTQSRAIFSKFFCELACFSCRRSGSQLPH